MQISLLVMLSLLCVAPFLTRDNFVEAYFLERKTIAVDNAAILIGRNDRAMTAFLGKTNKLMRVADLVHDALHICARIPKTAAFCFDKDLKMESMMKMAHARIHTIAKVMWKTSSIRAKSELARMSTTAAITREAQPPLFESRCPICGLAVQWDSHSPISSELRAVGRSDIKAKVVLKGTSLRSESRWDYRLHVD